MVFREFPFDSVDLTELVVDVDEFVFRGVLQVVLIADVMLDGFRLVEVGVSGDLSEFFGDGL